MLQPMRLMMVILLLLLQRLIVATMDGRLRGYAWQQECCEAEQEEHV